ncbi:class I SAM-dependent methyltransferase [Actinomycetospora atypica]|uniref:Class I SAM-dependent methyltransferase n=1 Tax=Actinomycetospora atypica TaxID=1290095 RepID=A0ABV9YR90_9PSEU
MPRATAFGTAADEYDRLRPAPHPDALAAVLPPDARLVVDLAAGTGLVTRAVLASTDAVVVAVEPDARMLDRLGGTRALRAQGVAEAIPVRSGTADAVLAASAWHWFDPEPATAEIARVLRPGGTLGLLWSRADPTVPWVAEVRGIGKAAADGSAALSRRGFDVELPPGHGLVGQGGTTGDATVVGWTRTMTRDEVAGMVCTYSGVLELDPDTRADVRHRVRARLGEMFDDDRVEVPFETVCRHWRRD